MLYTLNNTDIHKGRQMRSGFEGFMNVFYGTEGKEKGRTKLTWKKGGVCEKQWVAEVWWIKIAWKDKHEK